MIDHKALNIITTFALSQIKQQSSIKLEHEVQDIILPVNELTYDDFLMSLFNLINTFKYANYMRWFRITRSYFTVSDTIKTHVSIVIVIEPRTPDLFNLNDTDIDITLTTIQRLINTVNNAIRNSNTMANREIQKFLNTYNLLKSRTRQDWLIIIIDEYNNKFDSKISVNEINTEHEMVVNGLHVFDFYKEALEAYLVYVYNIPVFYAFGLERLGSGVFGSVYKISDNVAVKKATEEHIASIITTNVISYSYINEVSILKHINNQSPYIINMFGYNSSPLSQTIVMENGDVSLAYFFNTNPDMQVDLLVEITHQVLQGLNFLELNQIVHGDLKSENILVHQDGEKTQVKLIDFGFSRVLYQSNKDQIFQTLKIRAPEIVAKTGIISPKMDIWSLGMILHTYIIGDDVSDKLYLIGVKHDSDDYLDVLIRLLYYALITESVSEVDIQYLDKSFDEVSEGIEVINDILRYVFLVTEDGEKYNIMTILAQRYSFESDTVYFPTFDMLRTTLEDTLLQPRIELNIHNEYSKLYELVSEHMLTFNEGDRSYASQLVNNNIFAQVSVLSGHEDVVILDFRVLDIHIIRQVINEYVNDVREVLISVIQFLHNRDKRIMFDTLRLSLTMFAHSVLYMSEIGHMFSGAELYNICYVLASHYFGEYNIDLTDIIQSTHTNQHQIYVMEAVDHSLVFYDERDKTEYLRDLNIKEITDISTYIM